MNKKLVLSVLSTAVVASMAASAMAKPDAGFYVGGQVDKYYNIDAFFNHFDEALDEIVDNLDSTTYVDADGNAASFQDILTANGDLSKVMKPASLDHFEKNPYAIVDGEGTWNPENDPDLLPVDSGELKVESVSAINSTQLQVKFTKAVDEDTVITSGNLNTTNIEIAALAGAQSVTDDNATAELVDGKTLIITTAQNDFFKGSYTITVKAGVKDADGNAIEPFSKAFTVNEEVKPTIASAVAKTAGSEAGSVDIIFSEPVQAGSVIKIDGVQEGVTSYGLKTTVTPSTPLDASKSHTIEVVNLKDGAGNTTAIATKTFTIEVDANAPQVASVEAKGDKAILVKFNKKVKVASLSGLVNAIDANSFAAISLGAAVAATPGATTVDDQVIIPVTQTLYSSATTRTLNVMFSAGIEDELGNKSPAVSKTVTLSKDTVAPAITGLTFTKNSAGDVTSVTVNFSEGLAAMTANDVATAAGKVRVIAPDGTDVTSSFIDATVANQTAVADYATSVKLAVGTGAQNANLQPGAYTFIIQSGFAKDKSETGNVSGAFTTTLDFGKTAPGGSFTIDPATAISSSNDNTNTITINFGQAVKGGTGAASATNPANYSINGKALPDGTVITLDSNKEIATIEIPKETYATTDTAAIFTIANVQNAAGVTITPVTHTLQITDNKEPVLDSAVLNNDGTITIGFSEELSVDVDPADLVVKVNDQVVVDTETTVTKGVGSDAGKYVVTVKQQFDDLGDTDDTNDVLFIDLNGNGSYDSGEIVLKTGAANGAVSTADDTAVNLKTLTAITKVVVGTIASGTPTGADAAGNTLKLDVVKTVK
ncbi:Ig-like domain-containing protein [Brevibacillus aydinogluensis]|uniref:SbsA Ig-like domain-containing protein n=1 Tax=Brevibacillus aydinogluensis TaxID=927786 RepID=A0AA48M5D0_9BACL|nr:Ig-like domain-containing protein [Brevibacillus aydinogluensis]CAJ1000968.1 hypothetical protein BSPP4475_01335 [Brevibacillus aydinogluensis]